MAERLEWLQPSSAEKKTENDECVDTMESI
jgi:hypothetical protein